MLDKAVDMFVNPGKYGVLFSKQYDDVASMIMEAGNKKYFVHAAPNRSFKGVERDWGLNINYM